MTRTGNRGPRSTTRLIGIVLAGAALSATVSFAYRSAEADLNQHSLEEAAMPDKERLAKLLESVGGPYADMVRSPRSRVDEIPTPFFGDAEIYRVYNELPARPVVFTFATLRSAEAIILSGNPEAFYRLVEEGSPRVADDATRLDYVITFLSTTRSFGRGFQILGSIDDIQRRPNLTPDDEAKFETMINEYGDVVMPPTVRGDGPWTATAFALRDRNLVKIEISLGESAGINNVQEEVLVRDVPTVYRR